MVLIITNLSVSYKDLVVLRVAPDALAFCYWQNTEVTQKAFRTILCSISVPLCPRPLTDCSRVQNVNRPTTAK